MSSKLLNQSIVAAFLVLGATYNVRSEIIGWWRFEEGAGTVAIDSSGHENHGTIVGDPQWVQGMFGMGLELDGAGDYVDIGPVGLASPYGATKTIAGWVKATSTSIPDGTTVFGFAKWANKNAPYWEIAIDNQGNYSLHLGPIYSGSLIPLDTEWHHIVWKSEGDEACAYLDGELQGCAGGVSLLATQDHVSIGAKAVDPVSFFAGIVDDIRVYDHAVTLAEVEAMVAGTDQPVDLDALHEGFRDALNTQDPDAVASYYHEDATWDYVALPPVHEGKEQIRTFYDEIFNGFPDFHVDHRNRVISENTLITECTITATHLGEIFEIPGTGNSVQLMHMDIYEYEGDKIKHMTTYDDAASFLVQFGVMPDPGLDPAMLVPSFALPAAEPTGLAPLEAGLQLDALYDAHDLANYATKIHPDAEILLAPLGVPLNREQFIAALELYFLGFPDLNQEIVRSIDMGDGWAAFEVIYKGNNTGPYFGMPPTQRYSEVKGAWIAKFDADGLCTNMSAYFDNITVLSNLGLFPPPDPEANKTLERRVFDEIWNQGLLDVADEVFAPDATLHLGADDVQGPEAFKAYVAGYRAAFPDIHWTVEDQIAEGEMVVTRLTGTGTHQGELMGIPATGLPVTVTAVATVRIAQGKIQESWSSWDALGLMQQLGVMPPSREGYAWGAPSEVTGDPGDPAANTAQVLYVVQKFWNEHIVAALDNTHTPDALAHNPVIPGHPLPYHMYKHACLAHLAAFPDFYVTNENVIAEGDKVAVRWTVDGTHLGELMGMPPTGRAVTFKGSTIYRFADGKIVESWWCYDALGMIQQITGPYCASPIPGDVNDDCKVDCADLAIMGSHWLEDNNE